MDEDKRPHVVCSTCDTDSSPEPGESSLSAISKLSDTHARVSITQENSSRAGALRIARSNIRESRLPVAGTITVRALRAGVLDAVSRAPDKRHDAGRSTAGAAAYETQLTSVTARMIGLNIHRRIAASEEFQQYAARNQWENSFCGPAEARKVMEGQYGELRSVMTYLALTK